MRCRLSGKGNNVDQFCTAVIAEQRIIVGAEVAGDSRVRDNQIEKATQGVYLAYTLAKMVIVQHLGDHDLRRPDLS